MTKSDKKEKAIKLRKEGYSLNFISKKLFVAKSSVSLWVRHLEEHEQLKQQNRKNRINSKEKNTKYCSKCGKEIYNNSKSGLCRKCYNIHNIKKFTIYNGRRYIRVPKNYEGTIYKSHNFILYARFVVEQHLGRYLSTNEDVHHKDGNKLNDTISNLEVLSRSDHTKKHCKIGRDIITLVCPTCNKKFSRERRKTHLANNKRTIRTFCSRSCSTKYYSSLKKKKSVS